MKLLKKIKSEKREISNRIKYLKKEIKRKKNDNNYQGNTLWEEFKLRKLEEEKNSERE
jgi:hypothetical protein